MSANHLIVKLATENAALRTGLANARSMVSGWAGDVKGELAGALTFGAVVAGIKEAMDKAGELVDISARYGVGVEELQKYANAAQVAGASLKELETAFKNLVDKQQAALAGNDAAIDSFAKLGMSVKDLEGQSAEQLYLKLADAIAGSSDKSAAFAAMMDIVGFRSRALFETLQGGSAAILEVGGSFSVMSEDSVLALEEMGDEIAMASEAVKNGLGGGFVFVTKLVQSLLASLTFLYRVLFSGFYEAYQAVAAFTGGVLDAAASVRKLLQALVDFVTFDWEGAADNFKGFTDGMQAGFEKSMKGMTEASKDFWAEVRQGRADLLEQSDNIWAPKERNQALGTGSSGASASGAARIEAEAAQKLKLEEAIKTARERAAAAQKRVYEDLLSSQERLNLLKAEELDLLMQANTQTLAGLEATARLAEVQGEMNAIRVQQDKLEEASAKQLEELRESVSDAEREAAMEGLSLSEQRLSLEAELLALRQAGADAEADQLTTRLKELELEKQLKAVKADEQAEAQRALDTLGQNIANGVQAPADFMQSIGGGGNVNQAGLSGTEALIAEYRRQRDVLLTIAKNTAKPGTLTLSLR